MPGPVAAIGMTGSLLLGAGAFGLWILDPALEWGSYLVAAGGLGLGVAIWFSAPEETAVLVGDAGVAVEDGRDLSRIHWHEIQSVSLRGGTVLIEAKGGKKLRFVLGANLKAAAFLFQETLERVPSVFNIEKSAAAKLPPPDPAAGQLQAVVDDQIAGTRCAATQKPIQVEEEGRACPRCGQIYHKDGLPEQCVSCEAELKGRALVA
jgi:hypothetical protein